MIAGTSGQIHNLVPSRSTAPMPSSWRTGGFLVTGRNVNGGLGCYGWVGDLEEEAGVHAIGGPRRKFRADLTRKSPSI